MTHQGHRGWAVVAAMAMAAGALPSTAQALPTAPHAVEVASGVETLPQADLTRFRPGNIISDQVFYASNIWGASNIQEFLDTQGARCSEGPDGSACLKNYVVDTEDRAADTRCAGAYVGAAGESAATVIAKVSAACGINPQVLLVLLQKEQGLVTTTAPTATKYRKATGFGCPDTAACDARYYGFFNQVYQAAWQFKNYALNPSRYSYRANATNMIRYHPNVSCGSSAVYIENQATASLYNYTPYQPNAASLAAGHGLGDSCSSYGNRNFWNYFNDWFGSSTDLTPAARSLVQALYVDLLDREGEAAGVSSWAALVASGASSAQMVAVLTNSEEYLRLRITEAYENVLGREPDESGLVGWVRAVQAGVLTVDDVSRLFYESPEFYLQAGASDEQFVANLYERMLGRPAATSELSYWAPRVGQVGRGGVAVTVWMSMEAAQIRAATYYETFLGRTPEWSGQVYWARSMLAGGETVVRQGIAGSTEYWQRSIARYPAS